MGKAAIEPTADQPDVPFAAAAFDEGFDSDGQPRGSYAGLFDRLDPPALEDAAEWIRIDLARRGVVFGGADPRPFAVDPIPRIIEGGRWERVEAGLEQRVRALNAFLADVYREGRVVEAGVVPQRVLDEAEWWEPAMALPGAPVVRAHVAGPDLVRCPDGEFQVIEDNLRAPSGLTYLLAAREAVQPLVLATRMRPCEIERSPEALLDALRSAAPDGVEDPYVVLLTDGPGTSSAYYEHVELARLLGLGIAITEDLHRDGDRLVHLDAEGNGGVPGREVDVIYRRVDDERLTERDGTPTDLGRLLIDPLLAGTLGCANSPGSGIADDKAIHTYVEAMISFYLDEEPILPSVPGWDLGDPAQRAEAMPRLEELVIKPRSEFGGAGVLVGPLATDDELREARAMVEAAPERYVAQVPVPLSVHPTVIDGEVRSRHVDLRPFVFTGSAATTVMSGGLTRFAREEGEMIVNSGRGGGAKDTWVLEASAGETAS